MRNSITQHGAEEAWFSERHLYPYQVEELFESNARVCRMCVDAAVARLAAAAPAVSAPGVQPAAVGAAGDWLPEAYHDGSGSDDDGHGDGRRQVSRSSSFRGSLEVPSTTLLRKAMHSSRGTGTGHSGFKVTGRERARRSKVSMGILNLLWYRWQLNKGSRECF